MIKELKRILAESKPMYPALLVILVLSLIEVALTMISPWFYRELVNFLTTQTLSPIFARLIDINQGQVHVLVWLVIYFLLNSSVRDLVNWVSYYLEGVTGSRSYLYFAYRSLQRVHQFSVSYFEKISPGWLRERIFDGVRGIYGILQSVIVDILPPVLTFAIASVIIFRFNAWLAAAFWIVAPIYVGITIWRARVMRFWQNKIRNQNEKAGRTFMDNLNYFQLVKEFSREDFEQERHNKIQGRIFGLTKRKEIFLRISGFGRELIYGLGFAWVYGYGGYLVLTQQLSVGDLVLFVSYLNLVMMPLGRVMGIYDSIALELVSVRRLFGIWDIKDNVTDAPDAAPLKVTVGAVRLRNVSFSYPATKKQKGDRLVFRNINLDIKPKEIVAVVGPSGAGKSTLVKLILRFYDPTKGKISIDGQDIRQVTQKSLRQQVATVMQDVSVFNGSVKYNLKYGRPNITDRELTQATKVANLYDFIMSLRRKFRTQIGERGVKLSGGERQRLAIARALIKDAPILVMDEATSALDSENEKKIQDAMWQLIQGRTTLIIAHRLSTVKRADRIIVLDKGRIVEQGTHKSLMRRSGYYQRLFKMQGDLLVK
ncbi:MAG: ABC transporter ATP-binding protein [bacterium]